MVAWTEERRKKFKATQARMLREGTWGKAGPREDFTGRTVAIGDAPDAKGWRTLYETRDGDQLIQVRARRR